MNDLELTDSHDLRFEDGDIYLLNEESRMAQQSLKISLLTLRGEWWLDNSVGVPYLQEILKKGVDKTTVDTIFIDAINNSYNIQEVVTFTSSITTSRNYIINFRARTIAGEIISITNLQVM